MKTGRIWSSKGTYLFLLLGEAKRERDLFVGTGASIAFEVDEWVGG